MLFVQRIGAMANFPILNLNGSSGYMVISQTDL